MRLFKGASFANGEARGPGYILLGEETSLNGLTRYSFQVKSDDLSFLFGFCGVGCHYRCEILPVKGTVAVYEIRDGAAIYLHHCVLPLPESTELGILWQTDSIRIRVNGMIVLNIVPEGPTHGWWGFAVPVGTCPLPDVHVDHGPQTSFEWICLGDGFSNNRWRNRHYLSWPELVFGKTDSCLNAAVAAGNTHRTLAMVDQLGASLMNAKIILAVGSDDLMEKSLLDDFSSRLHQIIDRLQHFRVSGIWLCTLPPRSSDKDAIICWNQQIIAIASSRNLQTLDFHACLMKNFLLTMDGGEVPGLKAQEFLGRYVATSLALPESSPQIGMPTTRGISFKIASKIDRLLARWTRNFPGELTS